MEGCIPVKALFPTPPDPRTAMLYSLFLGKKASDHEAMRQLQKCSPWGFWHKSRSQSLGR
jgi:hypothetical protein